MAKQQVSPVAKEKKSINKKVEKIRSAAKSPEIRKILNQTQAKIFKVKANKK